jgi:hypothetical protein
MPSQDLAQREGEASESSARRMELASLLAAALRRWLDGPGRSNPPSTEASLHPLSPLDGGGCSPISPIASRCDGGAEGGNS